MPEFCTCGAQLPPDALFCHKCGKPQRELVVPEIHIPEHAEFALPLAPVAVNPEAAPMNFHNRVAVRIALLVAVAATVLSFLPYLNWLAAGYFAVFLYRRRTGCRLDLGSGVRIGWMTGILTFMIFAVLITGFVILLNASGNAEMFQALLKNATDPRVKEMLQVFQNGPEIAILLAQLFFFITCLSMIGGALGAKLAGRVSRQRLAPAKRLAVEQPPQRYRDHRVHVRVDGDDGHGQPVQSVDIRAVPHQRPETDQVQQRSHAPRAPVNRVLVDGHCERRQYQPSRQLLHRPSQCHPLPTCRQLRHHPSSYFPCCPCCSLQRPGFRRAMWSG